MFDSAAEKIGDQTIKVIFKYKDRPCILKAQSNCEKETFRFSEVNSGDSD